MLIANAGVGAPTTIEPFNVGDVEKMFRVNVLGVVYSLEAVLPQMLERGRGHLAAVSSLASYKGLPGESGYTASKAAVNVFLEGLRIQLRSKGIAVTTICPGFVKTPMTEVNEFKMPWLLTADEAARRMVRALKHKRKVYNFPWQLSLFMKCAALGPRLARRSHDAHLQREPTLPQDAVVKVCYNGERVFDQQNLNAETPAHLVYG